MMTGAGGSIFLLVVLIFATVLPLARCQHAPEADEDVDYVVVGGGAAGIPLAYTLAEMGKTVLLIERGGVRTENKRETYPIKAYGIELLNKDIAQEVLTLDKFLTHVPSLLCGGTCINGGVYIEETAEYFNFLEEKFGSKFDKQLVNASYEWVRQQIAQPMGLPKEYSEALIGGLTDLDFKPYVGPSVSATIGSWNGFSIFENDGKHLSPDRFRFASDILALGGLAEPPGPPSTLKILTRHEVLKVEFDTSGEKPKATCVVYRASPGEFDRIDSRANAGLKTRPGVGEKLDVGKDDGDDGGKELKRACIKEEGGEIFLSAGALMSPVILMNSGVGPKDVVEKVMKKKGGKLVKDIPQLGQNLHERWSVQFGVFFKKPAPENPAGEFPVTITSVNGMKQLRLSEDCPEDFGFNTTPECLYVSVEEGSGATFAGLVVSTRAAFPVVIRTLPEVDFLADLLTECVVEKRDTLLCVIFRPTFECTDRTAGWIAFPPVPKSRGFVTVSEDGEPIVKAGYLTDEGGEDLNTAVLGLETLLRVLGSGRFDELLDRRGPQSCVIYILNKLVDVLILTTRALPFPFPGDKSLGGDLLADLDELSFLGREQESDEDKAARPKGTGDRTLLQDALVWAELQKRKEAALEKSRKAWREGKGQGEGEGDAEPQWRGDKGPVADWLREQVALASEVPAEPESGLEDLKCELVDSEECERRRQLKHAQQFAILPTLPTDLYDREEMEGVIKTHGNGMWHWSGSSTMGAVVDEKFRVHGIDNLNIVDAGVFGQASRMNVQAHSLMAGRMAGSQRAMEQQEDNR
ncbi:unnamed protein product [Vitrella brassicaformis CCMP3155]|uniref:Glucose-methanol-choline oxidoreductase N-terminal domain-containing protein n=3 Tax=Vitrella brassicaformis TaxID=1169539 RepID=A0A0G4ECS9_VITBC|nr:unnamed protein product [Vitrella brassicaformis CCMP3155]|eukprot:CEL93781.1 unnamed protein product [Vitrella brassicaformis CCMP3155]